MSRRDWLLLAIIILAALTVETFFLNYTVDDAFITFRYSRNLANGLGLVFNPGERVEGFTNFLWMLYCTIPFVAGIDVLWFAKVTLMLLSAGNLILMVLYSRRVAPSGPWWLGFVPASLIALHTSFTLYAVNGMETQLFCFLLLLSLYTAADEFAKGGWLSAIFFGLLFYTRPDGLMFFAMAWFTRLLFGRRGRGFWVWTVVFLAMAGGLTVFRIVYFGYPVPNTYYVKSAGTLKNRVSLWGYRYFRDIFRVAPNWLYVLLPLASVTGWRRLSKQARFTVVVPFVYLAYVLCIGGDVNFPHFRFLLHVLPLMAATACFPMLSRSGVQNTMGHTGLVRAGILTVSLACIGLQLNHSLSVWKTMNEQPESGRFRYFSLFPLAGKASIYPDIARHLREACRPGSVVVMQDVGAIPFYSGVRTFDIIGLVNGPLARYFFHEGYSDYLINLFPPNQLEQIDAHVRDVIIDSTRADYVLYHVDSGDPYDLWWSFHYHNLAFDPRFADLYRPVSLFYYPGTNRYVYILFERTQSAEQSTRPPP